MEVAAEKGSPRVKLRSEGEEEFEQGLGEMSSNVVCVRKPLRVPVSAGDGRINERT